MGRVSLPMDVSSSDAVPAFENMLTKGPMAVVLVYADWCGHCDKYKKNVWSPLKSVKNRTVNMASLREDMLPKTSLKNAKIDGYPSILVVGKDNKPAVFNSTSGTTNALPESNDVSTMKSLVTAPVPTEVTAMNNSMNNSINAYRVSNNSAPINTGVDISYPSLMASAPKAANVSINSDYDMNYNTNVSSNFQPSNTPTARNTIPPSINEDEAELPIINSPRVTTANNQGTTPILRGGRLFRKLSMKRKVRRAKKTNKRKN